MTCHASLLLLAALLSAHLQAAALQIVSGAYTSGKIYVSATFDGARERCLLDTGSAASILADTKRFGPYPKIEDFRFKSATGIEQSINKIQLHSIQLDALTIPNPVIGRANFPNAENTLGIDILNRQPFALTFKIKRLLTLNPPPPNSPATTLHVSKHGHLSIPLQIGAAEIHALWDTGCGLTTVDQSWIQAHPADFKPTKKYMQGTDGGGHPLLVQVFHAKKITIENGAFKNSYVVAADLTLLRENISPEIQAVIGFNLVKKADWFFDAKNRLWKIDAAR